MDPATESRPWRALEAPSDTSALPSGGPVTAGAATTRTIPTGSGRIIGAGFAAAACAVLAILLAVGGSGGGAVAVDGGGDLPLGSIEPSGGSEAPAGLGVAVGGSAANELVVEVAGAVARPGVVRLSPGARVTDAIAAAGGYGPRIDTVRAGRELRLASPLRDGDQVRVPSRDDPVGSGDGGSSEGELGVGGPGATAGAASPGLISLNQATADQLDTLPGIGPVTAAKILTAREEAPFTAVDELRSRGLVGEKTFATLRDLVTAP